jgi:Zn-dependent metalloprotease
MVKQWRGGHDPQKAIDADWLIGAGIFNPATNIAAIRSMKDPGTAYDTPLLGKDPQVAHMDQYADLPDDEGHDVSTLRRDSALD